MTLNHADSELLAHLLDLARHDVPATAIRLADRLGRTPDAVRADLARLDAAGAVDASRCRLSFLGLALATQAAIALPTRRAFRRAA